MSRRDHNIAGKVVLISGAARGIGAAAARRLHGRGAKLVLIGLEPALLRALSAELGERAVWYEADVRDAAAVQRAVAAAVKHFGGIDVVLANAGIYEMAALADVAPGQLERTIGVNLFGLWNTVRAALPQVIARKGYILNVASMAALTHGPLMGGYAASKAAVEALTDSLRVEMSPRGVGVGCAYFAAIDTDLTRAGFGLPAVEALRGMMPAFLRRPASLALAVDAIEQGIRCRSARIWAPHWLGAFLLLRGAAQPLLEWSLRRNPRLPAALALACPESIPSSPHPEVQP